MINFPMKRVSQRFLGAHPHFYLRLLKCTHRASLEKRVFLALLRAGDVIIDAGANRGYFTELFSDIAGPTGKVHAFEPGPPTFRILRHRIEAAGCRHNCVLNEQALGDEVQTVTLHLPGTGDEHASLRTHASEVWSTSDDVVHHYPTAMTTLDSYTDGMQRLDYVKCDVEGAELLVIRGGTRCLQTLSPICYFEVNAVWAQAFGYAPSDIVSALRDLGYDQFYVVDKKVTPLGHALPSTEFYLLCGKAALHANRFHSLRLLP